MARIEANPDRGRLDRLLDLPGSFDVRSGLVVQRRFVAALPAERHGHLDTFREAPPAILVQAEAAVFGRLAWTRTADVASGVGQRRLRSESVAGAHGVEDIEQTGEAPESGPHLVQL